LFRKIHNIPVLKIEDEIVYVFLDLRIRKEMVALINHLDEFLDPGLKSTYWEFILLFPCEICNYIRFNYKRITDSENTIITTGASALINGRKSFANFISPPIGVIYSSLYWDGTKWVYYYNGILQAILNEDLQCPFGIFELTEESFFGCEVLTVSSFFPALTFCFSFFLSV
jgi:hypothetical protein